MLNILNIIYYLCDRPNLYFYWNYYKTPYKITYKWIFIYWTIILLDVLWTKLCKPIRNIIITRLKRRPNKNLWKGWPRYLNRYKGLFPILLELDLIANKLLIITLKWHYYWLVLWRITLPRTWSTEEYLCLLLLLLFLSKVLVDKMDVRDQTLRFWYFNWHDILQFQQWLNALFPKKQT